MPGERVRLREGTAPGRKRVAVVGGGLAGCEAAWQIVRRSGANVDLYEMRPTVATLAHTTAGLAELVCSNSLKSDDPATPTGALKRELASLGSLLMAAAQEARIPAGKALAVDRALFSATVSGALSAAPEVTILRGEATDIPEGYDAVVIATGPLTSPALAGRLGALVGAESLYFYDAIAPIVEVDSLDPAVVYRMDRYGEPGTGDYLNVALAQDEYYRFVDALLAGGTVPYHDFEEGRFFDGCMPIEEIARRGRESLAFGPLKPVGLTPADGRRPYAAIQFRRENEAGDAVNMVGFQTKLTYPEQERIFREFVPGMKEAVFLRHGSLHRNTYLNGPAALNGDLTLKAVGEVRLAGQMTGVEGYVESMAIGALAGIFTADALEGRPFTPPPPTSALGALLAYVTTPRDPYVPTNMNFSLFPPLATTGKKLKRKLRREAHIERARADVAPWLDRLAPFFRDPGEERL
ncbi:MAG: methylenetetrahydrofolate--tRNA-(uracil(54)-C(5))-methyltransferase (FADH(2)-oxidizing) TrmFO [Nitrospinae bacterium]|nr:methylenetetrahydrofolate--tRNA-(uracil(54)-C(5))-methyltransferase (FADH(2)-oxidizing) TrmFO [Nitrospinota bacterium]